MRPPAPSRTERSRWTPRVAPRRSGATVLRRRADRSARDGTTAVAGTWIAAAYCAASVMSIGPFRSRTSMKYHSGTFGAIGPIGSVLDCVTATTFIPAGGVTKRLSCDEDESASASSVHADTSALYAPAASVVTTTSGPGARGHAVEQPPLIANV